MEKVVEVNNMKRVYEKKDGFFFPRKSMVEAVKGISFWIKEGEIFGLLGENGAGKTTTIKMLITLLAPSSGSCRVLGHETFGEENIIRPQINFIFGGEMGVYRRLSARDNLMYFAGLYKLEKDEALSRTKKLLEIVGLLEDADRLVETFSKGMIQRLQIARGLINNPKIIFMDEPTVGLDPMGARMLRQIILKLKAEGKTIFLTTHYMFEADELCDRIAIMNKGKILVIDTPETLKKQCGNDGTLEDAFINILTKDQMEG